MALHFRFRYLRRVFAAYLIPGRSQLTFWHETPEVNPSFESHTLGPYYMTFAQKADYGGPFDDQGIPLLDYRGYLGLQKNPIAIAQYGLANYNRWAIDADEGRREKFVRVADWLRDSLRDNSHGIPVWMHDFDWEYRATLKAPWYSGLAQGQGISLLVRAAEATGERSYFRAAERAFEAFTRDVAQGGVIYHDPQGDAWIEEYLVDPPTHILNGFIWGLWGVLDYAVATGNTEALRLYDACRKTLRKNLSKYDTGYWSLYEQSGVAMPMLASSFYHRLHIVQLRVMHLLTGDGLFQEVAERWHSYAARRLNRARAFLHKSVFKLCHY